MPKKQVTHEFEEQIRKYADQIKTIEFFADAVRKTPGQYIGYIGNLGHINMIREVFQNSMDELQRVDSPCDRVQVQYFEDSLTTIISDNGRGIPYGHIIRIFTLQNTSVNFEKKEGDFTAGRHGVGSKVTNALSSEFFVNSYILGEGKRIEFRKGRPWDKGEVPIPNNDNLQGTIVEFRPDPEIMGEVTTTCEDVLSLVSLLLPLVKIGATVDFYGVKKDGSIIQKTLVNQDGILSFLIVKTESPIIAPIYLNRVTGKMKADIAFTYDFNALGEEEDIISFANTCPTVNTINSTHVNGFIDGLCNYFRNYMNKFYLNKSKITAVNNDIKGGLKAVVSVAHIEPHFSGQAKEIFSNKDIEPFVKTLIYEGLDEWCKNNPSDLQKLCRHFKANVDLRMKGDKEKINMVKRYNASSFGVGLPTKYLKPNGNKNLELIIVEGDSAKGPCTTARCQERQGIFPVRGKVANAMTKTPKEFWNNEESQAIRDIIGCGFGKSFDLSKCKFEKVIILADADLDGRHIRTLLLKMFLVYYTPLVEDGRLYGAEPPLYYAKIGNKFVYFPDKASLTKYVVNQFSKQNEVYDARNNKISDKDLVGLLYRNSDYVRIMNIISDNYSVDPYLLEYSLQLRNLPFEQMKKKINSVYRFLNIKTSNGITMFDGLVGEQVNTVIFNQSMMDACVPLLSYIDNEESVYIINGQKTSLYGLLDKLDSYRPSSVDRFKGLGQMDPYMLRESTLHPDYNRTLIRYTTDNIKKEIEAVREIECNKNLLLKDVDIAGYEL